MADCAQCHWGWKLRISHWSKVVKCVAMTGWWNPIDYISIKLLICCRWDYLQIEMLCAANRYYWGWRGQYIAWDIRFMMLFSYTSDMLKSVDNKWSCMPNTWFDPQRVIPLGLVHAPDDSWLWWMQLRVTTFCNGKWKWLQALQFSFTSAHIMPHVRPHVSCL